VKIYKSLSPIQKGSGFFCGLVL